MRRLVRGIARYELVVLGVATPFLLFPGLWTPIGVALIALTWGCRWAATGRITKRTPMDVPIILLVIVLGVSLIPSVDLRLSLNRLWTYILGIALFYGMVNGLHDEHQIQNMGVLLVVVGMGVALVSLVSTDFQSAQLIELPSIYGRLPPPLIRGLPGTGVIEEYDLVNPRVTAGALAILLPVGVGYLVLGQGWKVRLVCGLTASVMAGVLLLTQSPQGLLGLGAALFLILVWRTRWFLLSLAVGVSGLLVAWMVPDLVQTITSRLAPDTVTALHFGFQSRVVNAARGLGMIRDMPYTGIGLNTFPVVERLYTFGASHAEHAHNMLVQTGVDLGVPGLAVLLALLATFGYTAARAARRRNGAGERALLAAVCGALAAWLAYGLLDTITLGHKPAAALWAMMGLAGAMGLQAHEAAQESAPSASVFGRKRIAAIALPLLLVPLVGSLTLSKTVGALYLNLGVMEAHRALASRESSVGLAEHQDRAEGCFRQAIGWDPGGGRAHRLLDWALSDDILKQRWPRETL